ncbi:MAG: 50S ribosomal protein L19, partial [Dehalococcoidia bacterium]
MDTLVNVEPKANIPALNPGDTVKVAIKIVEGERTRNQMFQGVVIKVKKGGINSSFTVRRVAYGVGVERTFFFASPSVDKVEVLRP